MRTDIIIPARYASERYPGKPLVALTLPDGSQKPLVQLSWEAAKKVRGIDGVYVATDDERIRETAEAFGAEVIMTSERCENGTERCAEAIANAELASDIVVNFQGDAPLTPPWFVETLVEALKESPEAQMATPILRCDEKAYRRFREDRARGVVGATTAVCDLAGNALYFSKEVIPWISETEAYDPLRRPVYHHVGVYAFRAGALARYTGMRKGKLEILEGLEQLRFLENGVPVRCIEVEARGKVFWELNNPHDRARIEGALE
jgi:3-deoxy-manno-octulosonate cytidylyltransferase (CMP-KDO synthetase)